jgi:hypothetical protein
MKEELQGKLVEILTSMQSAAGKASDFAMEQLPDIAQSYVAFGRAYHTFWIVSMVLVLLGIGWGTIKVFRLASRPEGVLDDMPPSFAVAFGSLIGALPFLIFLDSLKPALLVWFAPKVWLLKEIATMLK